MQDFRMDTFLAVCKYMNYTKAASALSLTQPAVSQHIRYLENAYGVPLFEQSGKKIFLTEAGEILYRAALTMKHDEEHMKQRMLHTRIKTQNYSFGATLTVAEFMLLDDLKGFILSHPQSRIRMQVENTRELLRRLDSSEIDFAIVEGDFPRDEYEFLPYKTEQYIAVASPRKSYLLQKCRRQGSAFRNASSARIRLRHARDHGTVAFAAGAQCGLLCRTDRAGQHPRHQRAFKNRRRDFLLLPRRNPAGRKKGRACRHPSPGSGALP